MRELPPERLLLLNRMKRAEYQQFRALARRELHAQADELRHRTGAGGNRPSCPTRPPTGGRLWEPMLRLTEHERRIGLDHG